MVNGLFVPKDAFQNPKELGEKFKKNIEGAEKRAEGLVKEGKKKFEGALGEAEKVGKEQVKMLESDMYNAQEFIKGEQKKLESAAKKAEGELVGKCCFFFFSCVIWNVTRQLND